MLEAHEPSNELEKRYAGVRAMWAKVIIRAMYDWAAYRDSDKLPLRKVAENAARWLFSPSESFNSLENICYMLEISPQIVREKARTMTKSEVSKIEHVDRAFGSLGGTDLPDAALLLISCKGTGRGNRDWDDSIGLED